MKNELDSSFSHRNLCRSVTNWIEEPDLISGSRGRIIREFAKVFGSSFSLSKRIPRKSLTLAVKIMIMKNNGRTNTDR